MIMLLFIAGCLYAAGESRSYNTAFASVTDSQGYTRASADEIIPYIKKAASSGTYSELIIGDSVCHQMFNRFQDKNSRFAAIGSNDAITMAGQYLLARQYVEAHPGTTDIYLILRSYSGNGFTNLTWTYGYLVIPFTETGLIGNLDQNTIKDLNDIFGAFFMKKEVVTDIDCSPMLKKLFINHLKTNKYDNTALSSQYLSKIIKMCDDKKVKLHFIHAPVEESDRQQLEDEKKLVLGEEKDPELRKYIDKYYDSVTYYPDDYFRDGVHFDDEHGTDKMIAGYIDKIKKIDKGLEDFKTE